MNSVEVAKKLAERPDATIGIQVFHDHLTATMPQPEHGRNIYAHLASWLLDHLGASTHEDGSPALTTPIGYVNMLGQLAAEVGLGIDANGTPANRMEGVYDPRYSLDAKYEYLIQVSGAAAGADFEAQVREEATMLGFIQAPDIPPVA